MSLNQKRAQKELELKQFSRFQSLCRSVPSGSFYQPDPPEPDIVLRTPQGSVGIELTAIHPNGASRRWQESEQEELLNLAKEFYRERGHDPISIWVHWSRNPPLLKATRRPLADQLCRLVVEHCSPEWTLREVDEAVLARYQELPVAHLGFAVASSWDGADWREGAFHEVAPLGIPEVQSYLEREEEKASRYREVYSSLWLVLLCESAGPSSWGATLKEVWTVAFRSSFQRVFLVELGHRTCGELRIA